MPSNSDPAALGASSKPLTIPKSIRDAQERAGHRKNEKEKEDDELKRQSPVIVAYRDIYKYPRFIIGLDAAADDAWRRDFAKRLVHFGKTASESGYAENIRALTIDNYPYVRAKDDSKDWVRIAMDLVKEARTQDEDGVLALIRSCPPPHERWDRWDVVFNDRRLLDQILDPQGSVSGKASRADSSIAISGDGTVKTVTVGGEGAQEEIPRNKAADEQASDGRGEKINAIDSHLSERGQLELTVLLENQAFDSDHRLTIQEIAVKATGPGADANAFKHVNTELKSLSLIETKEGRGGGCWLTPKGKLRAEKMKMKL